MPVLSMLAQVDIFQAIPQDILARLVEQGRRRTFSAGSRLICEGELAECLHLILTGRVRVERSHPTFSEPVVLVECGPGDVVGELGVLDGEPRRDSVMAVERTETVELSATALAGAMLEHPELAELLPTFSRRLRTIDELATQHQRRAGGREVA